MKLSSIVIALIALSLITDSSCRTRRRKHRPGLFSRSHHRRVRPNALKSVYYYSVPRTTVRPRIILGDNLDFTDIGVTSPPTADHPQTSYTASPQPPRPKGPGYRLKGPLSNHYVVSSYTPKPAHSPLSESLSSAAKEMRKAYKTALIHSAKIAHFTTSAGASYFKGIRNILYRGGPNDRSGGEEAPILTTTDDQNTPSLLPSVHVDWGSSFWNLFYNQKNDN